MESRKMVLKNLFTGSNGKSHREEAYGHGERRGEGEMYETYIQFSSAQLSHSVVSDSL